MMARSAHPDAHRGWSPRWVVLLAALTSVLAVVVIGVVHRDGSVPAERTDGSSAPPAAHPDGDADDTDGNRSWMSGSAGQSAVDGEFAQWRGRPVDIVATWADDNEAMVHLWTLHPGAELDPWDGPIDIAVGALDDGESWERAAAGAYDDRWRESLTNLAELREGRDTTYIRFAHEMNGDWYPWSVDVDSATDFVAAWKRYRALQQEVFPESRLVFNVNRESVGTGTDWREMFPGADHVDVFSVDYYNHYPWVSTRAEWERSLDQTDRWGAPKGLARHQEFARSVGLPLAISEWSNNAEFGDSPAFFEGMHQFLVENGGTGPGEVLYEILFNIERDDSAWIVYPVQRMPDGAHAYRELW